MSSPIKMGGRKHGDEGNTIADGVSSSLDVGWLLHPTKDASKKPEPVPPSTIENDPPPPKSSQSDAETSMATVKMPEKPAPTTSTTELQETTNGTSPAITVTQTPAPAPASTPPQAPPASASPSPAPASSNQSTLSPNTKNASKRPHLKNRNSNQSFDENSGKKDSRRNSWISNLSSKFSSSTGTPRSASVDAQPPASSPAQVTVGPKVVFADPFAKSTGTGTGAGAGAGPQREVIVPQRRPQQSVLVHAGQETKTQSPSFLQSALRRLSSSGSAGLSKTTNTPSKSMERKIMNVDQNRERVKISDFDQNKLKRVAFCVDVEIAGFADHPDTYEDEGLAADIAVAKRQSLAMLEKSVQNKNKKETKDSKKKDNAEGAALKKPQAAIQEKETQGHTDADAAAEAKGDAKEDLKPAESGAPAPAQPQPIPSTKKKEKKKRSEAERKERKERKRKLAEANGQVPLELSMNDDDDSSPGSTPPGSSTPVGSMKAGDKPTTDPLRIYKRCSQLRETTPLKKVIDQISMPSSTLVEAPGTVAALDLSGIAIPLSDVVTLGDWLAVVPVRKLILENCDLTDEGVRVILSGLLGCKSSDQVKQNKKLPKRGTGKSGQELMGVIEKISLKSNPKITSVGWKNIGLFMHMCRSLKAIDVSEIPFPKSSTAEGTPGELSQTSTAASTPSTPNGTTPKQTDLCTLISKGLAERFGGDKLEELIMSGCNLSTHQIGSLIDGALKCRIRRLGLANNNITQEGLDHIVRFAESGVCEGLDLGSNDLHDRVASLAEVVNPDNSFFALSLADCNLHASDLKTLLPRFAKLKNFRFIDLSRNRSLFSTEPNAVSVLRRYLPQMTTLKRIHLADADLSADDVIGLAEILPECPSLAHISILENAKIVNILKSGEASAQEEACALLAALMTAVRVSNTLVAIEVEVPSAESSEVVKALAQQVVAYSLKNLERLPIDMNGVIPPKSDLEKDAPEILLHIVGSMEGYNAELDLDEPAPDEDYVIGGTGVVKALGVCLKSGDFNSRAASTNISPSGSGTNTPRTGGAGSRPLHKKPRDMAVQLLESARKIRTRLQPAILKEDREGNDMNYRRLLYLDTTLARMIERFEEEYPETKIPPLPKMKPNGTAGTDSMASSLADASMLSTSTDANSLHQMASLDETPFEQDDTDVYAVKLARSGSNTSLAAKALHSEEGRMHKFGQSLRREILVSSNEGANLSDEHIAKVREKLTGFQGQELVEIRDRIEKEGLDEVLHSLGTNTKELLYLEKDDPAAFEAFRQSQVAAKINSGL